MTERTDDMDRTDAHLESLLDEAIGPQSVEVPADLAERIVARTSDHLAAPRPVLARVGFGPFSGVASATAAVIVLALGAAIWIGASRRETRSAGAVAAELMAQIETIEQDVQMLAIDLENGGWPSADDRFQNALRDFAAEF